MGDSNARCVEEKNVEMKCSPWTSMKKMRIRVKKKQLYGEDKSQSE